MTKWEYISKISACGDRYGYNGGICDLLDWCKKPNTLQVTETEAQQFYELIADMRNSCNNECRQNCN